MTNPKKQQHVIVIEGHFLKILTMCLLTLAFLGACIWNDTTEIAAIKLRSVMSVPDLGVVVGKPSVLREAPKNEENKAPQQPILVTQQQQQQQEQRVTSEKINNSAYLFFQNAMMDEFRKEHPEMSRGQLEYHASIEFKELSPEVKAGWKAAWTDALVQDRYRYAEEFVAHELLKRQQQPVNGESSEEGSSTLEPTEPGSNRINEDNDDNGRGEIFFERTLGSSSEDEDATTEQPDTASFELTFLGVDCDDVQIGSLPDNSYFRKEPVQVPVSEVDRSAPMEVRDLKAFLALQGGPVLVNFCVESCVWCQRLELVLKNVAKAFRAQNLPVAVGIVRCDEQPELCSSQYIDATPTLLWYQNDNHEDGTPYTSTYYYHEDRTTEAFVRFARDRLSESPEYKDWATEPENDNDRFEKEYLHTPRSCKVTSDLAFEGGKGSEFRIEVASEFKTRNRRSYSKIYFDRFGKFGVTIMGAYVDKIGREQAIIRNTGRSQTLSATAMRYDGPKDYVAQYLQGNPWKNQGLYEYFIEADGDAGSSVTVEEALEPMFIPGTAYIGKVPHSQDDSSDEWPRSTTYEERALDSTLNPSLEDSTLNPSLEDSTLNPSVEDSSSTLYPFPWMEKPSVGDKNVADTKVIATEHEIERTSIDENPVSATIAGEEEERNVAASKTMETPESEGPEEWQIVYFYYFDSIPCPQSRGPLTVFSYSVFLIDERDEKMEATVTESKMETAIE